ncbi:MAG: RelA/SpoT family protein [Bacteroidales bacterium]|nr:RelA/SpoT family protein [Bacteroidales bacterium]
MKVSEADQQSVQAKYDSLLAALQGTLNENDRRVINEAFDFAAKAYGTSRHFTGELLICHALAIARIAAEEMGLGINPVVSAILHDVITARLADIDEIRKRFGPGVSGMVFSYARISELPTHKVTLQSDAFRKLFLAVVDDIRVILLKLAHRMRDMRMIEKLPPEYQARYIDEVNFLYSPIAHRLGLYRVKKELEDLAMKFTQPEVYQRIAQLIRDTESKRNAFINEFIAPIQREMFIHGFTFDVKRRPKSIPSIWGKMQKQDVEFEQVFDLFAVRIILQSSPESEKSDCWKAYSIVTNIYPPNPKRLRDWISTPKASGYESLHTTVKGPNNKWVEVQIRSARMDEIAEKGQAAHWKYKGFGSKEDTERWLLQVRDLIEHPEQIKFDETESVPDKQKPDKVFVFTPTGDLKELELGATVLDFAFEIHTNVGYSCTGAKVNNKIVPLKHALQNGDKVEIITSKIQKPKMDWLNYVITNKARNKIKRALKEDQFLEAEKGNEILRRKFRNWKITFNDENIDRLIKKYKLSSSLDLYVLIYNQKIDLIEIKRYLSGQGEKEVEGKTTPAREIKQPESFKTSVKAEEDVLMIDRSLKKVNFNLAKCCNPAPGDAVFGFVTISRGITIHRGDCPNADQLLNRYGYRKIEVQWKDADHGESFRATIQITGTDRIGMMNEISQIISNDLKVNMISVKIDAKKGIFNGIIKLMVKNNASMTELIKKISRLSGVTKVTRL